MKLIVANWKMNPETLGEARTLASLSETGFTGLERSRIEVGICPPFVFLPVVRHVIHFVKLGAQNLAGEEQGPFTGEVSAPQLREFETQYVIVGHSERRGVGETNPLINKKMKIALKYKLEPILCVGYGAAKSATASRVKQIVKAQLRSALQGVNLQKNPITVAYEPVWAISKGYGKGAIVKPRQAAEIINFITSFLRKVRVIYGGSMDAKNAAGFAGAGIAGGLVGGASLDAQDFLSIIKAFTS